LVLLYLINVFYEEEDDDINIETNNNKLESWISKYKFEDQNEKIKKYLSILDKDIINLDALRYLSHSGIPEELRGIVWKYLLGYLPCNKSEQKDYLNNKRNDYIKYVDKIYPKIENNKVVGTEDALWDQIYVDVIRTFPMGMEQFCENEYVRECLCRILYVYSTVHQRKNYWQGLNEIPVPFLISFVSFYIGCSLRELNNLSNDAIKDILSSKSIEADTYWCVCKFVKGLQFNNEYVVHKYGDIKADPILQRFELLCSMVDQDLLNNLKKKGVEFIFFAFRWMVCLLTREIPIIGIMRLWDSYFSEGEENVLSFHLYISVSFLLTFSDEIQTIDGFEKTLTYMQRIPTEHWTELHAEYLINTAHQLKKIDLFYKQFSYDATKLIIVAFYTSIYLVTYKQFIERIG